MRLYTRHWFSIGCGAQSHRLLRATALGPAYEAAWADWINNDDGDAWDGLARDVSSGESERTLASVESPYP